MQISKETVALLKNYSTINNNLLIKPGNVLSTITTAKTLFSTGKINENFPVEFGIYDLNEFLGALSIFDSPDVEFDASGKFAKIKEGKNSIKFYSAESTVLSVPTKEINFPDADVEFDMSVDLLNMIMKTSGVLHAQDVIFTGDGKNISVTVGDTKNTSANTFTKEIGETSATFTAYIKIENFKFMIDNYKVSLSSKKIAKFYNDKLEYVLAMGMESTFGE